MTDLAFAPPWVGHIAPHEVTGSHGRYRVRPACAADEPGLQRMLEEAPPDDIRLRFFRHIRCFPHELVEPLTRMNDARHFAYVATKLGDPGGEPVVASAMMVADAQLRSAEFGLFVARSEANQRLGTHLMRCLIDEARGHGIGTLYGLILAENADMIDLTRRLGFRIAGDPHEPGCVRAELSLAA